MRTLLASAILLLMKACLPKTLAVVVQLDSVGVLSFFVECQAGKRENIDLGRQHTPTGTMANDENP
jgi:hypothetical protein